MYNTHSKFVKGTPEKWALNIVTTFLRCQNMGYLSRIGIPRKSQPLPFPICPVQPPSITRALQTTHIFPNRASGCKIEKEAAYS